MSYFMRIGWDFRPCRRLQARPDRRIINAYSHGPTDAATPFLDRFTLGLCRCLTLRPCAQIYADELHEHLKISLAILNALRLLRLLRLARFIQAQTLSI